MNSGALLDRSASLKVITRGKKGKEFLKLFRTSNVSTAIRRSVLCAVSCGELDFGDFIPTIVELAMRLEFHPNTIAKVYQQLKRDGITDVTQPYGHSISVNAKPWANKILRYEIKLILGEAIAVSSHAGFQSDGFLEMVKDVCDGYGFK